MAYIGGNPNPWCRSSATIPATMEAVLEALWEIDGAATRYNEHVECQVLERPSAHCVNWTFRFRIVPLLPAFEVRLSGTWTQSIAGGQKEVSIVFLPVVQSSESSSESRTAACRQLTLLRPGALANTTEMTIFFQLDLGSHITAVERVSALQFHRRLVSSTKEHFQKQLQSWLNDVEADCSRRNAIVNQIRHGDHLCSEEESALIAQGTAKLGDFGKGKGKVRSLKMSQTVRTAQVRSDEKTGQLIGEVECAVRGVSPEELVAYLMHFDSKLNESQLNSEVDVRYEILEVKSLRHMVAFSEMKTAPLLNRTFMGAMLWQKICEAPVTYVWVAVPIEGHPKVPAEEEAHALRGEVTRCFQLTGLSDGSTKMRYVCSANLKGRLPQWFSDQVALPSLMQLPYKIQTYFLQLRPPSGATAADGVLLGHLLVDLIETSKRPERALAISRFVSRTAMLRECGLANLDAMIQGIVDENIFSQLGSSLGARKFRTVYVPEVVATDPLRLTQAAAAQIGHGFESVLRISPTADEAVDSLLKTYPVLGVTAQWHEWFRPMLLQVAKRRMASTPFGLRFRLGVGAFLSIGDMASDFVNVIQMFLIGQSFGASVLLGMLLLNLVVQGLIVVFQNVHRGWKVVSWELGIVLTLLKPAIDAVRVAGGHERVEGAPVDPFIEMVSCKMSELTFESIPGGLAQATFLLNSGHLTTAAVVSVALSCLSTAFTTATLAYELDSSPSNRKKNPDFYGYIPDAASKRLLTFALLFLYHGTYCIGKTFSMACLAQTNWLWLVGYLLSDHLGFILYKLARGDLSYWVPRFGLPLSMLARFMAKVVTDFTGLVHLRHPYELGGGYFFVNALVNVCSWFAAAAVYVRYSLAEATESALSDDMNTSMANYSALVSSTGARSTGGNSTGADTHASKIGDLPLFTTIGALAVLWLLSVVGLSLTISQKYLSTFVSLQTGCAYTQRYFTENEGDDAERVKIFWHNERQWRAIRDRVRQWVLNVYSAWKALMPAWLTEDLKARIPDEFIPAQALHEMSAQAPGGRRLSVKEMGVLRRMSHAPPVPSAVSAEDPPEPSEDPRQRDVCSCRFGCSSRCQCPCHH